MSLPEAQASDLARRVQADFAAESRLASAFPGYVHRAGQVALATEIAGAVDTGKILLAEAETGIGKTLAYLVPALRFGGKTLISTHTRALQDQLMHRDIPAARRAPDRATGRSGGSVTRSR